MTAENYQKQVIRQDHKYKKSCKDYRKNVQCFIKILVKGSSFNVSPEAEQRILIDS